jgi:hypothetical protein
MKPRVTIKPPDGEKGCWIVAEDLEESISIASELT